MASVHVLPSNFSSAQSPPSAVETARRLPVPARNSGSTAAASDEVSTRTIVTVAVILGVFLVASVVGAVVTFVETEAKDASRNHKHTGPTVEYIRFGVNDTPEDHTLDVAHEPVDAHGVSAASSSLAGRNVTSSFGRLLEALARGGMAETDVQYVEGT